MATYVLIHGAATDSWCWHPLVAELQARGHDVVAPDMPITDDAAGLAEYADAVIDAIGDRTDLIVVAHSFGGFVGPLVCDRVPVDLLVMLHAQTPAPGESPGDWWTNSGYGEAGPHTTPAAPRRARTTRSPSHCTTPPTPWRRSSWRSTSSTSPVHRSGSPGR